MPVEFARKPEPAVSAARHSYCKTKSYAASHVGSLSTNQTARPPDNQGRKCLRKSSPQSMKLLQLGRQAISVLEPFVCTPFLPPKEWDLRITKWYQREFSVGSSKYSKFLICIFSFFPLAIGQMDTSFRKELLHRKETKQNTLACLHQYLVLMLMNK